MSETEADYARALEDWRAGQERSLRGERSWLSLIALEWIRGGKTRLGSDPQCDIVLPDRTVPAQVGVLRLGGERVVLQLDGGVEATVRGRPITRQVIQPDSAPDPDIIDVGRLSLMVIAAPAGRSSGAPGRVKVEACQPRYPPTGVRCFAMVCTVIEGHVTVPSRGAESACGETGGAPMGLCDSRYASRPRLVMERGQELQNVPQACREFRISPSLFHRWRKRCLVHGWDELHPSRKDPPRGWPLVLSIQAERAI